MNKFPQYTKKNKGMTYVELIVVLSIFSVVTTVSLFNYKKFQQKVGVRNLANDMALKFIEAQKNASFGRYPPSNKVPIVSPWKPSYGLFFKGGSQDVFPYVDLNSNKLYTGSLLSCNNECLGSAFRMPVTVASITEVRFWYLNGTNTTLTGGNNTLHISYTRPDTGATFYYGSVTGATMLNNVDYAQITMTTPEGSMLRVRVAASGRVHIF